MPEIILLPAPRQLEWLPAPCTLAGHGEILLAGPDPQQLWPLGRLLKDILRAHAGREWPLVAGSATPAGAAAPGVASIALILLPGSAAHPQEYSLAITPSAIEARAASPAGLFYAIQTLRQVIQQSGAELPALRCRDWPDFPVRGVMLDVSRDKVPTMETLYALVDELAGWKVNQLQLYTEHTFAYRAHPEPWAGASPITGEEILALDDFCRERFVELVPNQNTFGHMNRWLIHERYRPLAECPQGCDTVWGHFDDPFSLCPSDPGSLELVRSLLDELLPYFSSRQVNVGCDETVDLGQGRSRELVQKLGIGRVYLDFVQQIYREVSRRGRAMQYWGDIIMQHPGLASELPRDAIALEWGYEADHPFDAHGAAFAASGAPFYVCPGTSSWNSIAGRTDNALGNLRSAAANGLKHGAAGYLNTDWGDNGHWQPLPVSYLGFAAGAAFSWAYQANADLDIPRVLDAHAFRDAQGVMGKPAYDLGNVYQRPGILPHNSSVLFRFLQSTPREMLMYLPRQPGPGEMSARFAETAERIDAILSPLAQAEMQRPDAALVQREFAWVAAASKHACLRMQWAVKAAQGAPAGDLQNRLAQDANELIEEFRQLWLARNRPGGLKDSQARWERMRLDYRV